LGLFLEGSCAPGSLVALFPGLVYSKADYRRMPGYPKVDRGNPYLVAAYSGHVVDSLPWRRGWMAPPGAAPPPPPPKKGYVRLMVEASDGPRRPPPPTAWPGPEHLLEQEVVGMGLVALAPIGDGEEVVFNYRLSPGLGRPRWYVSVDEEEEDRRWA
ncbi:MAG: hypothetical protein J3K34DRAFT_465451, partial [Monoraphidium minutum]